MGKLVEEYVILKSSVANTLTGRAEHQDGYVTNLNKDSKPKLRLETGKNTHEILFDWFTAQRAKRIPISGPLLHEKAREIAEELGHLIAHRRVSGESASVNVLTNEEWKTRLQNVLRGYNDDHGYNADETGLLLH